VENFREKSTKIMMGQSFDRTYPSKRNFQIGVHMGMLTSLSKENAIPQRAKPFRMQGERLEAHKIVTKDWATHWFIERPPKGTKMDWLSTTFVVPKKSKSFPWRGLST
jgi:hypothetical protein